MQQAGGDRRATATVFQLPGLEPVLEQQLLGVRGASLPHGHRSFFFLAFTGHSVQAFDIRTAQLFCEFRLPSSYSLCLVGGTDSPFDNLKCQRHLEYTSHIRVCILSARGHLLPHSLMHT